MFPLFGSFLLAALPQRTGSQSDAPAPSAGAEEPGERGQPFRSGGSSAAGSATVRPRELDRPNIVLVVLDDLGVDRIGLYGETPVGFQPPCTPSIDALAAQGVLFTRAYADPLCSPTRAQILTGRHGFRTGIGGLVDHSGSRNGLSAVLEDTLPEILVDYDSSCVGKWHLANPTTDGLQHPLDSGYHYFSGSMFNLSVPPVDFGSGPLDCSPNGPLGYYSWVKARDVGTGVLQQTCSTTYATTDTADEAIARAQSMSSPWFLEVSFNASHAPAEMPPPALCPPSGTCGLQYCQSGNGTPPEIADAMVEALDTELGRMIAGIRAVDPDTYFIVISDNGTDSIAARGPAGGCYGPDRSKGTLYQGGIRVPLMVAGPRVVPGVCDRLVSAVDVFATVADLAHVPSSGQDSVSLLPYLRGRMHPRRSTVYCENFTPNFVTPDDPNMPDLAPRTHLRAVLNTQYKLIRYTDENGLEEEAFFDLAADPCEQQDLFPGFGPGDPGTLAPAEAANFLALKAELVALGVY